METEARKPNIQDLQTKVVELLRQVSYLMHRASGVLSADSGSDRFAKFEQEIINVTANVEDFELRMAIVAPMKAGKSTIINAIIGQDLLPSRNSAMTTIPTEIIFDAKRKEPLLNFSPQVREVFEQGFFSLQHKIQELGMDVVQKKLGQYPHLVRVAERIATKISGAIDGEVLGRQRILANLGALNDIVRLCSILDPMVDPLELLTDVPRIYTPFWRSQTISQLESPTSENSKLLGKLVIIDTPGPNEAGENLTLVNVVADQLEKCSLVLIVLDFTQLRTEAAEKVKRDVQRVIEFRGKDNLYVLINKVDQRRKGDMTPEQVQQFVAAELGLAVDGSTNRVFEIAARRAFCAANFIQGLEQPLDDLRKSQTALSLAQEVFGIDWEEELEEATLEELEKKAQKLWQKSGFAPFLENAISALIAEAAPRCILSALNVARGRIIELQEDVQLRSQAINQDEEKLKLEVEALEADLQTLESCRNRLQAVYQIKDKLDEDLNSILESIKKVAKVTIETYFNEEEYQRTEAMKKTGMEASNFLDWIHKYVKSPVEVKGVIEFKTLREAEEFADIAISYPKGRADILLKSAKEQVSQQIEQARTQLTVVLERETQPIIERARDRLNETFNINLSLPTPRLESTEINFDKPRVKRHTRVLNGGVEEQVVTKKTWWYWFGLIPRKETIQIKKPEHREAYYSVSLQEIVTEVNQLIEQIIKKIKQEINQYLDEDFHQRVDNFFNDLDTYLTNYCDSLKQVQLNQQLSLELKEKLVQELSNLVPETFAIIENLDGYMEETDRLKANQ